MADSKDKQIKDLTKRIEQLEEAAENDKKKKADSEDLGLLNEAAQKLLEIELQLADARGDGLRKMELAREMMENLSEAEKASFEEGGAAAEEMAQKFGMSAKELQRLVDIHKDLGPIGTEAYKMMRGGAEDVAVSMGLVSKKADRIVGGIMKIGKLAKSPEGLQGMAMAIKDTLKPMRLLSSFMLKVAETTIAAITATDKATAAFAKQTGMGRVHTAGIAKLGTEYRNMGIGVQEAGKAFTSATEQISGFNGMSEVTQQKVTLLGAQLERLGVSSAESMAQIEEFRKTFGASVGTATNITREMALTAKGLGMSMSKYMKSFKSANKQLAVYGKQAPKIFGKVAAAARAAGVETEALLGPC
jgi:hypothetical protein